MTDARIIDMQEYLSRSTESRRPDVFSVWGGDGGRSRFALPVWRAIYLLGGDWGGIVRLPKEAPAHPPEAVFILDVRQEPARTHCPPQSLRPLCGERVPSVAVTMEGGVGVFLGTDDTGWWFLQIQGGQEMEPPTDRDRETLLFLAGECAGLLFYQELATPSPSSSSAP